MTHPLFVFALREESVHLFDDVDVIYTGVGKVAAAHKLTHYLLSVDRRPDLIINCGTAGSAHIAPGSVVQCHAFVQRDMDVTALGFAPYQTPFATETVPLLGGADPLPDVPDAICGTGDHFVTQWPDAAPFNLVDMEAYALAHVARAAGIPFMALKYISDNADDAAHTDWGAALQRAAHALREAAAPLIPAHP